MPKKLLTIFYTLAFLLVIYSFINFSIPEKPVITEPEKKDTLIISPKAFVKFEKIDSLMNYASSRRGFNGNVLININGELEYKNKFGFASFRPKDSLELNTPFNLASVSKQFTAMAVMILAEEGKIDYDDSVYTYLPKFTFKNITIRHLLNHTSGLPNYMYYVEHKLPKDSIPYNDVMLKIMLKNNPKLNFNPGRKFSYCNTGYAILPLLVEKVSGQTFADFVETKIFKKLGMNDSYVYSRLYKEKYKNRTMGYFRWRGRFTVNLDTKNDGIVGDKGVYSTINDLRKWDKALYNNTLVSDSTIDKAFARVKLSNGRKWHYGFGFRIKEVKNHKVVYHFGRWNSFKTYLGRYIDSNSTIILLNNTNRNLNWLVKKIEHILLEDSTEIVAEQDTTVLQ